MLALLLLIVCAGVSIFIGPVGDVDWNIIRQLRLPRVLLAIIVGFGLATAGAVLQGVLRNPLADPFILGTSSAAMAGVMVAGLAGAAAQDRTPSICLPWPSPCFRSFWCTKIAQTQGKTPVQTLILAGVIVSLFFNAWVFRFLLRISQGRAQCPLFSPRHIDRGRNTQDQSSLPCSFLWEWQSPGSCRGT